MLSCLGKPTYWFTFGICNGLYNSVSSGFRKQGTIFTRTTLASKTDQTLTDCRMFVTCFCRITSLYHRIESTEFHLTGGSSKDRRWHDSYTLTQLGRTWAVCASQMMRSLPRHYYGECLTQMISSEPYSTQGNISTYNTQMKTGCLPCTWP